MLADAILNTPAPSLGCDCYLQVDFVSLELHFCPRRRHPMEPSGFPSERPSTKVSLQLILPLEKDFSLLLPACPAHRVKTGSHPGSPDRSQLGSSTVAYIVVQVRELLNHRQGKNCKIGVTALAIRNWGKSLGGDRGGYGTRGGRGAPSNRQRRKSCYGEEVLEKIPVESTRVEYNPAFGTVCD